MEKLYSCKTASDFFAYSQGYFRRLIDKKLIPYEKQGSNVRFKESDLVKHFKDKNKQGKQQMKINEIVAAEIKDALNNMQQNNNEVIKAFSSFNELVRAKESYKTAIPIQWGRSKDKDPLRAILNHFYKAKQYVLPVQQNIDKESYIDAIENGRKQASYVLSLSLLFEALNKIQDAYSKENNFRDKKSIIDFSKTVKAKETLESNLKKGFQNV